MRDGSRFKPYEQSPFYADGQSSRPLPQGTIPRGQLAIGAMHTGLDDKGQQVKSNPLSATREILNTGRERYNMSCALCHGRDGYGEGIIVQRGFVKPPSFHEERLRKAPDGHYFSVMTHGFGAMYPQVERLSVQDRWAVVHYVRALQLSQNAAPGDVPAGKKLAEAPR
ncbi:MAG TPA: cytochrome c [Planctomycetota bacterium]|nr:cytochrome c [Planctomycetota bacterium]